MLSRSVVKDFCGSGRAILSINRICAEFQLFHARFGIQLIRAAKSLIKYLEDLPGDSLASASLKIETATCENLRYATSVLDAKIHGPKFAIDEKHWANAPKQIRKLAWRFFLTPDCHSFLGEKITIKKMLASKNFLCLKKYLVEKLKKHPAPTM